MSASPDSQANAPLPPVVLTIAGSDNSGGAGLQADLKTFSAQRVFGATAVTCVVAEHPGRVLSIEPLPPLRVTEQIRLVAEAYRGSVAAAKTGMLYSRAIIEAVAAALEADLPCVPLVIDPVMVASSGAVLLQRDAVAALERLLIPRAALVTPNRDEAELLLGAPIRDLAAVRHAARALADKYGVPFLVKGGHLQTEEALDVLSDGRTEWAYSEKRIPGANPHGTGCTFSAAVAAGLAKGLALPEAVGEGKRYITRAIARRFRYGEYDLLNHFAD